MRERRLSQGKVACRFVASATWRKHGDNRQFVHFYEERAKEVCKLYATAGWCRHGGSCWHLHDTSELESAVGGGEGGV